MNCRDVREMADSFLCEELLTETNHEMLRHLGTCSSCGTEIEARRQVRDALRDAFSRAPELQPSLAFEGRLRRQLREASAHGSRSFSLQRRWLALAASMVIAAGIAADVLMPRTGETVETLARDAVGDHRNCALKYRLVRMPVPLEEAAQKFDSAYRVLRSAPPDRISTPDGVAEVTERHSCAYGARRFGHVIMQYRGRVVSLLMTANDEDATNVGREASAGLLGHPMNGLSVVSVNGIHHAILLVSDLDSAELTQLSQAVLFPLVQRLEVGLVQSNRTFVSLQFVESGFKVPPLQLVPGAEGLWRRLRLGAGTP